MAPGSVLRAAREPQSAPSCPRCPPEQVSTHPRSPVGAWGAGTRPGLRGALGRRPEPPFFGGRGVPVPHSKDVGTSPPWCPGTAAAHDCPKGPRFHRPSLPARSRAGATFPSSLTLLPSAQSTPNAGSPEARPPRQVWTRLSQQRGPCSLGTVGGLAVGGESVSAHRALCRSVPKNLFPNVCTRVPRFHPTGNPPATPS